jgi:hypothetical protein
MSGHGSARLGVLKQKRLHQWRWSGQRYEPAHQNPGRLFLLLLYLAYFLVIFCLHLCEGVGFPLFLSMRTSHSVVPDRRRHGFSSTVVNLAIAIESPEPYHILSCRVMFL